MTTATTFTTRRVYDPPSDDDGFRVLVDRLWPRGLTKEKARIDLWAKQISPSDELRKQFHHDAGRWDEFRKRYSAELEANGEAVSQLLETLRAHRRVTLLFGARETEFNNAVALKGFLEKRLHAGGR